MGHADDTSFRTHLGAVISDLGGLTSRRSHLVAATDCHRYFLITWRTVAGEHGDLGSTKPP